MEIVFLIGRILFGGFFFIMGINHFMKKHDLISYAQSKGVPSPALGVAVTGILLVLGGLGVILGVYPQISLILLIIFLVPTSLMMHNFWADEDPQMKMQNMQHFMKNVALIGAALALLFLAVPWELSLNIAL